MAGECRDESCLFAVAVRFPADPDPAVVQAPVPGEAQQTVAVLYLAGCDRPADPAGCAPDECCRDSLREYGSSGADSTGG